MVFVGGRLQVRKFWNGRVEHLEEITPEMLDAWAVRLEEVSDGFDAVEYRARRSTQGGRAEPGSRVEKTARVEMR